jgi:hypothetical protein
MKPFEDLTDAEKRVIVGVLDRLRKIARERLKDKPKM